MKALICCLLIAMHATRVLSWGYTGHYMLGETTFNLLSESTQNVIRPMLVNGSMGTTSIWADAAKFKSKYAFTRRWHYFDSNLSLPPTYCKLDMVEQSGPNILTALHNMSNQFIKPQDPSIKKFTLDEQWTIKGTDPEMRTYRFRGRNYLTQAPSVDSRQFALFMLIHLLQDLSQPLHLTHVRKAGLQEPIKNHRGKLTNLHSYLDVDVVDQAIVLYGNGTVQGMIDKLVEEAKKQPFDTNVCSLADIYTWAQHIEQYNCDVVWRKPYNRDYHRAMTVMGFELMTRASVMSACYWEQLVTDFLTNG